MKRFIAALLGFLFLCTILYTTPAQAEDPTPQRKLTMEEAITYANQEIGLIYYANPAQVLISGSYQTKELNRKIWDEREILVYGQPSEVCDPVKDTDSKKKDTDKGYYRYLGYTANGDLMPDPEFREDHASTTLINNYDWERNPWDDPALTTDENEFDGKPENLPYIKEGLREKYKTKPTLYDENKRPRNANTGDDDWHTVTKILQPRTNYTPGLGRMWHNWNGSWWYITVVIPVDSPKKTDIEVVSLQNETPVPTSTDQVAGVTLRNNGNETTEFEVQYYVGATQINKETLTLDPGETLETGYEWKSPATIQNVVLKALTVPVTGETKIDNNEKTFTVQMANSVKPPCANVRTVTGDWM